MLHAGNPKRQKAEAGRWQQVPCQPGPHSKFEASHSSIVRSCFKRTTEQNELNKNKTKPKKQLALAMHDQHLTQPMHRQLGFTIFNGPCSHQLHPFQKHSLLDRKLLPSAVTPTFCPLSAPEDHWSVYCPRGLACSGHFIEWTS